MLSPIPYRFANLRSLSATAENVTGQGGGRGRTYCHARSVPAGNTMVLCEASGAGMIRGLWLTVSDRSPEALRSYLLRCYWDGSPTPSVEVPFGDFFGLAHGRLGHYSTPYLGVSEGKGFWCFFPMPFAAGCRIEFHNDSPHDLGGLFWQINFTLGDSIDDDTGRFHALFRRDTPPLGKNHLVVSTTGSPGVYLGTVIGALPRTVGTWREGELRFYLDGETDGCSLVGTGWSDWFLSGWGLGIHSSPYGGCTYQVKHPEYGDKYYCSCYRFHVMDPIYFQTGLRVEETQHGAPRTADGWSERSDDWCSVAYWYQQVQPSVLPPLPTREERVAGLALQPWELEAARRLREGVERVTDGSGPEVRVATPWYLYPDTWGERQGQIGPSGSLRL